MDGETARKRRIFCSYQQQSTVVVAVFANQQQQNAAQWNEQRDRQLASVQTVVWTTQQKVH
jgi:hypothetical protein